ncbi:MAG: ABC transporter ATP-binding protein [Pseudomonadota bacterium]
MTSPESAIRVRDAWCVFEHVSGRKVEALREVDLDIPAGQFVCLVGRSGHGKSTLLRALGGLNPLTRGEVKVGDHLVAGPSAERGMVFQDDTVFPWMRVRENVEFGLRVQGMATEERRNVARDWLRHVDLLDFEDSWPKELSGGMRKRVALATVFAGGAPILLMDEPFGALDYVTRISLHLLLLDLWRETRRTIVFVTHDIEEALILADRILVMSDGRVVDDLAVGLPRPRDEEVRALPEAVGIIKTIMHHLGLDSLLAKSHQRRVASA